MMTMTTTPTTKETRKPRDRKSERGMSLIGVMGLMTLITIGLLAVAPSVQVDVQREKELESIRRGEEIAEAIRQYVEFYRGSKLPNSIDELLEGLPQGTKKRQILRPSAAVDPLSEDGKWRLIKQDDRALVNFAKRVMDFNNGLLPSNPSQMFDRYAMVIVGGSLNTESETDREEADETEISMITDEAPFIGVASQSRGQSVIAYYGIENHSKWIFTPLFRGSGSNQNTKPGAVFGTGDTRIPRQGTVANPNER